MSDLAIRVENLGKLYRIGVSPGGLGMATQPGGKPRQHYHTLSETLSDAAKAPFRRLFARSRRIPGQLPPAPQHLNEDLGRRPATTNIIWALKDISFEVRKGQVLGVIGRNGAGKSTLLKILSRVTEPTTGVAEVHGRVGSLLEVGTGFHPELTGRENIYLNGAILGMKRAEIDRKFDEIVAFSEVEKFIDTPVKRYSSGMYLRLAFAVAAHLEPEILVVDEVLAVGDAEFQRKCLGKMSDVAQEGRTILFVSHNMSAILRLTEETIVLDKGQLILRAPTNQAVDYYMSSGFSQQGERVWQADEVPADAAPFYPIAMRIMDSQGRVSDTVRSTDTLTLEMQYRLDAPITGLRVGIYLMTARGEYVFTSFDTDDAELFENYTVRSPGMYFSRCQFPADLLNEGRYVVGLNASSYRIRRYFQDEQALTFNVDAAGAPGTQWPEMRIGPVRPRLEWKIEQS
ncbi:MAG: ABC transporter ATP-binding protein [Anaerolineales bacterium]|nr:ABC transporter ATP-binding protein [Anaerolineales bacterium]